MLEIFSIVCYTVLDISTRRKPVERIKRNERMAALTKLLTASPNRIFTLSYFCEMFGAAKSTLSEDIDLLRGVEDVLSISNCSPLLFNLDNDDRAFAELMFQHLVHLLLNLCF